MEESATPGRPRARSDAPSHAPSNAPSQNPSQPVTNQPTTTTTEPVSSPIRNSFLAPASLASEPSRSVSPRGRGNTLDNSPSGEPHFEPPRRAMTSSASIRDPSSNSHFPRRPRADTMATQVLSIFPTSERENRSERFADGGNLHRRSTAMSRRSQSAAYNAQGGRTSAVSGSERPYGALPTFAGPEPTVALAQTYENYVSPGYVDLNPAYEQPAYAKPVWSLAKPLPRVVRAGMVPSRQELIAAAQKLGQSQGQPGQPSTSGEMAAAAKAGAGPAAENSHKMGLDVDPVDLEEGRVRFSAGGPAALSAQLKDSREQRETNFILNATAAAVAGQSGMAGLERRATRLGRTSSQMRRPRASTVVSVANGGRVGTPPVEDSGEEDNDSDYGSDPQSDVPGAALGSTKSRRSHEYPHMMAIPEGRVPLPVILSGDNSSVSTLAPEPDEWPELDPVKVVEHPTLLDEVHNNHTAWSVIRTQHREFLAEFLAVFMQLTMGFCVDLAHMAMNSSNPNYTAWGWGFATMVGIYVSGGISGAHLNPAFTFMLWFFRGFPKRKMPSYWLAQFLGALVAAFTAYGLYAASIRNYLATNNFSAQSYIDVRNQFVTSQRYDYIDPATAFFNEFIGTAMLSATVLALGDDQNAPPGAGMNSLIIGFVISLEIFAFSFQTGAALNPSRDFGPRLALLALGYGKDLFTNPYWFYGPIVGTFTGAFVGACLYDIAIFTGGESPINYPWTRTKRSFRKSKAKWRRRVLHAEKDAIEDTHWNQ